MMTLNSARLFLFTLAVGTSLSTAAAQTTPTGRPPRTPPGQQTSPETPERREQSPAPARPIRLTVPNAAPVGATPSATPSVPKNAPATSPAVTAQKAGGVTALPAINPKIATIPLTVIIPPAKAVFKPIPGAVMLTGRSYEDTIAALPVARRLNAVELRANPRITVGTTEVDFSPILKDPLSLPSIAEKMRKMSSFVALEAEKLEAAEITNRGLAIKAIVTYRLKPGVCDNPQARVQLQSLMARCFDQRTAAQIDAAFADPADPRYIPGKERRDVVVKLAQQRRAAVQQNIDQRIAQFRASIKQPQSRAQLAASVGEGEINRLAGLSDGALARELINQARVKVEDVIFIPRTDASDIIKIKSLGSAEPVFNNPKGNPQADNGDITVTTQLDPMKFLTGFTLGREYEWQKRIEATIPWCVVGCEETYFAEAYAGFGAGLGLRLPFEVSGTYSFTRVNGNESATFTPVIKTVNADLAFYDAVGLPVDQRFQAQELLAKFGAWAGLRADLPVVGDFNLGISKDSPLGIDFTADLPGDFKGGQFTPPLPCPQSPPKACPAPSFDKDFDNFDLTGGIANIGVAGAKVFPFIRGELVSDGLTVKLRDKINNAVQTISAAAPGMSYPLEMSATTKTSSFVINEPNYKLSMKLTPGVKARLFVDLAVWGTHWDFPVLLPQLGIKVPKGGKDFSCHEKTVCDRTISISPQGVKVGSTTASPYNTLVNWYEGFDKRFAPSCFAAERTKCEADLKAHRDLVSGQLNVTIKNKPGYTSDNLDQDLKSADLKGRSIVVGSFMKNRADFIRTFKAQCFDDVCRNTIEKLAVDMATGPNWGMGYAPNLLPNTVVNLIDEEFRAAARNAVETSKNKAGK